jgi:hypothetical protein
MREEQIKRAIEAGSAYANRDLKTINKIMQKSVESYLNGLEGVSQDEEVRLIKPEGSVRLKRQEVFKLHERDSAEGVYKGSFIRGVLIHLGITKIWSDGFENSTEEKDNILEEASKWGKEKAKELFDTALASEVEKRGLIAFALMPVEPVEIQREGVMNILEPGAAPDITPIISPEGVVDKLKEAVEVDEPGSEPDSRMSRSEASHSKHVDLLAAARARLKHLNNKQK